MTASRIFFGRLSALALGIAALTACGDDGVVQQEDDTKLVVSPETLSITEGMSGTFTLSLTKALTVDGAVQVSVEDSACATVSPQVLTYSAGELGPKTITVTGAQDADLANCTTHVVLSASGLSTATETVTVTDDDTQSLVLTPTAVTINEGGTGTFAAHLAFKPTADTTVTLTSADTARLTLAPATLTFTAANYAADQAVTLTALEDADTANNSVAVTAAGTGANGTVDVTITDNDTQGITATPSSLMLAESDTPVAKTFQITLNQQPSSDVTLTVVSSDTGAATVSTVIGSLTFTSTNYNQGAMHVVTVTPVSDADTQNESLNVVVAGGGLTSVNVPVTVTDNDAQAIVLSNATGDAVSVNERSSVNVGVALAFNPGAQVTVTVVPADTTIAGATPTTLTFDATNFSTPQNISVTGTSDTDLATETTTIALSSTGVTTKTLTVTVVDQDAQGIALTYSGVPGDLTLPESLSATALSQSVVGVHLNFMPAANTVVMISSNNTNLTTNTTMLTFTPANYAMDQSITLTAVDENNTVDETANVTFVVMGSATSRVLKVNIPDTDVQSFATNPATLPTTNEGGNVSFSVNMNLTPAAAINATITSSSSKVTFGGSQSTQVTIPVANTAQAVTAMIAHDADAQNETVTFTIHDNTVGSTVADRVLTLNVTDLDTMAFTLTPASDMDTGRKAINEGGADVTFTVALTAAPTASTTVTLTPSSTNTVLLSNNGTAFAATTTLTFAPGDFGAKTITVRAPEDVNLVDELFDITVHGPAGLGAPDAHFYMRKVENDAQSIVTTPVNGGTLVVTEGTPGQIAVHLQFQPVSTVTVTLTQTNPNDPMAPNIFLNSAGLPVQLLFTTTNYATDQIVAVSTPDDTDQLDDVSGTVTVSSPALASNVINVNLKDDDVQTILTTKGGLPSTSLVLGEPMGAADADTKGSFELALKFVPRNTTETITVAVPADGIGKFQLCTDATYTSCANTQAYAFAQTGPTAWNVAQTVYVRTLNDADVNTDTSLLTLTSDSPPLSTGPAATYSVTSTDDDQLNVAVTTGVTALFENGAALGMSNPKTATFTVKLTQDPTTPLEVDLTSLDTGAVSVSPATLTFTSANYTTGQTVTITALDDADVRNETTSVTVTSTRTPTVTVAVTVHDDDQQAFVLGGDTLNIDEGSSKTLTVALAQEPTLPVTVTVTKSIDTNANLATGQDVTVNGSATSTTLTFTPANYATAQNVVVAAAEDADLDHFTGKVIVTSTSGQTTTELAATLQPTFAVRDNDTQSIVVTADPTGLNNSAEEGGPYVDFYVNLGARPRFNAQDSVLISAPTTGSVKLKLLDDSAFGGYDATRTLTFSTATASTPQRVRWFIADRTTSDAFDFAGMFQLTTVNEAADGVPFGAANADGTATRNVFGIDDDTQQQDWALDLPTIHNGATNFGLRRNIAFGWDGVSANGNVAFTQRTQPTNGNVSLGFTDRTLGTQTDGATIASNGGPVSTEFVEFHLGTSVTDVSTWNVFTTSDAGIQFARYAVATGAVVLAPTVVVSSSDVPTDLAVAYNPVQGVYGLVYRRAQDGLQNLYFRTVTLATGAVSGEVISTNATVAQHLHPILVYTAGATTYGISNAPSPYVLVYNEALVNKAVRLSPTGAPLGSYTFTHNEFPGDNFGSVIYAAPETQFSIEGQPTLLATTVVETGPGQGENSVVLYRFVLQSGGQVIQTNAGDSYELTSDLLEPISTPSIAINTRDDDSRGDIAVAYDSSLSPTGTIVNQVGVALFNFDSEARDYRLTDPNDTGLFPAITWALDRWIIRYQTDNQTATGIRLRAGSFEAGVNLKARQMSPSGDAVSHKGTWRSQAAGYRAAAKALFGNARI